MRKNLGTLLVERGLITEKVLSEALQRQVIFGGRLGTNLMEMGALREDAVLKMLADQHRVPYPENRHFENIPRDVLDSIPKYLLEKHLIIPISAEKNRVTLAMTDPTRLDVIDEVSFRTNKVIDPVVATELRITQALERYLGIRRKARFISTGTAQAPAEIKAEPEAIRTLGEKNIISLEEQELTETGIKSAEPLDMSDLNRMFWSVGTRDDVAQTVIRAGLQVMDDLFILLLKGDTAIGWMAGGKITPPFDFGSWRLGIDQARILDSVRQSREIERGEGAGVFASNPWLGEISTDIPLEVIVCPLVLKKHPVAATIGFSWQRRLGDDEIEYLARIMRKASITFEILILKSRIVML